MEKFIQILNPKQKALEINLDSAIYGAFAEIGAGQEVARHFFQAGGAAGTIAKTISAYDMAMSDAIYGKEESGRYVCESRLMKMLGREYDILISRLQEKRSSDTRFFAFADTVAARSYGSHTDGHGWMGVRFQNIPGAAASDVIMHVKLLDNQNLLQQQALGRVGVNLIYACFNYLDNTAHFIRSLMDNLDNERIEIDMIRVTGPAFKGMDSRLLNLELIKRQYSQALLFDSTGNAIQPSDAIYKKNILVLRGSFRPPTLVNMDMLREGLTSFKKDLPPEEHKSIMVLPEISMSKLVERGEVDSSDFLARVDLLAALGQNVLISNKESFWSLNSYLKGLTKKQIGYVLGVYNLEVLMDESKYAAHSHGLLGALGQVVGHQSRLYLYPAKDEKSGDITKAANIPVAENLKYLMSYLRQNKYLVDVENFHPDHFNIWSRQVLKMIESGEKGWEEMVPPSIAKTVKEKGLFGFRQ